MEKPVEVIWWHSLTDSEQEFLVASEQTAGLVLYQVYNIFGKSLR